MVIATQVNFGRKEKRTTSRVDSAYIYIYIYICSLIRLISMFRIGSSQIFLKFSKQIELLMLIPTNLIFLKLVKVSRSYGPYKMTTFCGQ